MGEKNGSLFAMLVAVVFGVALLTVINVFAPNMMVTLTDTVSDRLTDGLDTVGFAALNLLNLK